MKFTVYNSNHAYSEVDVMEARSTTEALMRHREVHGNIGMIYCWDNHNGGLFSCIPNVCEWSENLVLHHGFTQVPVVFS